jgi:hypothetical protein
MPPLCRQGQRRSTGLAPGPACRSVPAARAALRHPDVAPLAWPRWQGKSPMVGRTRCRRREAGAVSVVAHDGDATACVRDLGDVVRAGRVETSLEDVPVDHDGAGKFAVSLALPDWAGVDHQSTGIDLRREVGRQYPVEPLSGGHRPGRGRFGRSRPSERGKAANRKGRSPRYQEILRESEKRRLTSARSDFHPGSMQRLRMR